MGDHDDQPVPGYLLQYGHDLGAGLCIKSSRRLIRQDDIRVVYESTRDRDSLHLTARHLGRSLVYLIAQSDLLKCRDSTRLSLRCGYTRQGQCELYVGKHGLVRDEVVALEDEADSVVSVGIPVGILVFPGADAVYEQITFGVLIKSSENVEHGGFAAARRSEYRNKLAFPEGEIDAPERVNSLRTGPVFFCDTSEFKHWTYFSMLHQFTMQNSTSFTYCLQSLHQQLTVFSQLLHKKSPFTRICS